MIHLYYGDGKGKTTAAIGLCVRAHGAGKRVVFLQFMKGNETSELSVLRKLDGLQIVRNTTDFGFYKNMSTKDKEEMRRMHDRNLEKVLSFVREEGYDTVILDEVTYAYQWKLVNRERLGELLALGKEGVELVMTGRNPDKCLLEMADYITEMQCQRHPFSKGIPARKGVEF